MDDDGDALRLATKLRIRVHYHPVLGQALACIPNNNTFEAQANIEDCDRDENMCVRLAIVRAAVEIARQHATAALLAESQNP